MALIKVVWTASHGFMFWELLYYRNLLNLCDIPSTFFAEELAIYRTNNGKLNGLKCGLPAIAYA